MKDFYLKQFEIAHRDFGKASGIQGFLEMYNFVFESPVKIFFPLWIG